MPLPPQWRWKLDRIRERMAGLFKSDKPDDARPKLCPACGTLVGATATKCHQCGTSINYSLAAASRSLSGVLPTETPVTYAILAINFLLFAVTITATAQIRGGLSLFGGVDFDVLLRLGARVTSLIYYGEWWRLVIPIFLHGGALHFIMNTAVLVDLGPQIEDVYGSSRYLFLYMATGVGGFAFTTLWQLFRHTDGVSIGASGSLMGLIGLALAITSRRGGAYAQMIRAQLLRSVILIFVIGFIVPIIDNASHFGGLATGFLLGRVFADGEPQTGEARKRAFVLGWVGALVILASFGMMFYRYFTGTAIQF